MASSVLMPRRMLHTKKMYKVISPVQGKNGDTVYWMRIGSAFENKDDSLNVYLDAFPKTFQLQIREITDEDRRRSDELRASRPLVARGTDPTASLYNGAPSGFGGAPAASGTASDLPY